jgi:hypothetical protein
MVLTKLVKSILTLFVIALSTVTLIARENVCPARVLVTKQKTNTVVVGAKVVAASKVTGKIYRAGLKEDMPYFPRLLEGDYKVTISMTRYQTSIYGLFNDCSAADDTTFRWSVEMKKGNPSKKVYMNVPIYQGDANKN